MKKSDKTTAFQLFSRILPAFFLLTVFAASGWGQETIHYWSFNDGENSELDSGNNEPTSIPADIGDGLINHELEFSDFTGTTINAEPGFDAGRDWAVAGTNNIGEAFEVVFSTEGYENITFSFAGQASATGYNDNTIEVSSDGGNSWEEVESGFSMTTSRVLYTFDLTSIDGNVDDNADFDIIVRYTFDVDGVTGGGNNRFDNIKVTGDEILPADQVATPVFNPGTGTYFAPFDLEITSATEDATIRYSFDSDDPESGTWVLYDDGNRPNISETTTIWAYAEKAGMDDSNVASAIFTFPVEVASIEDLQDIAVIGGIYRITGEVFMTYQNDSRNQKYFQDELDGGRGLKIDDPNGNLTTVLNIGDGVTNLTGTIGQFNRMIQFTPVQNQSPALAHSTGNTLNPLPVTLAEIIDENNIITVAGQDISVFQALLIEIEDLQFEQTGNFDSGTAFGVVPISDPTASLEDIDESDYGVLFRVEYANLEYNNQAIPQVPLTLTAIVDQRNEDARIFARDWDDFDIPDPLLFASPATISNLDYIVDEGPSDPQSFQLTGINLDGTDVTVTAPADFEISEDGTKTFGATITLPAYDGTAQTIWVRLKENLPVDTYDGNVTTAGGGVAVGDEATVAVSGEVTAPPVTEVPFETKFGTAENWLADGAMGSYNEKSYTEGGWFFHSSSAVRGGSGEAFDDSDYSFRDTGGFTIKNLATIEGMTGFSLQLRNWMGTASNPASTERDIEVSFDGGTSWETVLTLSQAWFDEFQVYQEFIYFFAEEQNLGAEELHIIISGGSAGSASHRINIGQFKALDEEPPPPPAVPNPVFDLAAGTYFENQTVLIVNFDDYEATTNIYYTLDGEDPTDEDALYDNALGILLEDGNGPMTLKAIAIDGAEESDITSAVYTFPLNVDNIEQLRQQAFGGLYRVDNPAVFIGGTSFRNTKFFQDDSGFGIQIDDPGTPVIDTDYDIGDQVAELVGTLGQFQGQLRLSPALDPGAPVDTGIEVEPLERTLDDLTQNDQSRLVLVYNVIFEDGDGIETFDVGGTTTNITDPSIDGFGGSFRNVFGDSDITGATIPEGPVNITGIIQENIAGLNLGARNLDDFAQDNGTITNLNDGIQYATLQHAVDAASPGDKIKFAGQFEDLDASDSGVILAPGTSSGCATFTGTFTLSSTETLEIEINGLIPCDEYDRITVGGTATLGNANLDVVLGFAPDLNDEFIILISGTLVGTFAQGSETTAIFDGQVYTFSISYDNDEVVLTVTGIDDVTAVPIGKWVFFLLVVMVAVTYMVYNRRALA